MSGIKDSARILKLVRQKAYEATLATMEKSARNALMEMHNYWAVRNITGNAWTSFTIGVFYKGQLKSVFAMADNDKAPTRVTLKKYEAYDLEKYYSGIDVDPDNPYVGSYGNGGQWGPSLGKWTIHRQHPSRRYTWNLVFIIPVSYAGYNERIVEALHGLMQDLPSIVDYSAVTVNHAPAQTDMFKDVPF